MDEVREKASLWGFEPVVAAVDRRREAAAGLGVGVGGSAPAPAAGWGRQSPERPRI